MTPNSVQNLRHSPRLGPEAEVFSWKHDLMPLGATSRSSLWTTDWCGDRLPIRGNRPMRRSFRSSPFSLVAGLSAGALAAAALAAAVAPGESAPRRAEPSSPPSPAPD